MELRAAQRCLKTRSPVEERGLIVVTGATGSGKSTTLAAMIEHINQNRACHILTIEDPIEFTFEDRRSVVNQREVGRDTKSFGRALKAAMRQDPDVILLGELRDLETVETALHAAETGHLVMATLHTVDAMETISRIIGLFTPHQQDQVRTQLSSILKAVVSQRLVRTTDGGRAAACEVLIQTEFIRDLIADARRTHELPTAIAQGAGSYGMQTFDQALMMLLTSGGLISYEEALRNRHRTPSNFALRVQGIHSAPRARPAGGQAPARAATVPNAPLPRAPSTLSRPPSTVGVPPARTATVRSGRPEITGDLPGPGERSGE
jgi:twitching motility protein PilT